MPKNKMKNIKSVGLRFVIFICFWSINLVWLQEEIKGDTIVFNGGVTDQKQKWQGPYHDKLLFTWFVPTTSAPTIDEYEKLVKYEREKGVQYVGYYYSSVTASPPKPVGHYARFPEGALPLSAVVHSSWILRDPNGEYVKWAGDENRFYLDIGVEELREVILKRAITNATRYGANVLFLDNWNYKCWAPAGQTLLQWANKTLSLLKRARELTQGKGFKLVVNTPSAPENWPEFATYLDGIAYEMGAHPNRLANKELYESELHNYEKIMEMGKSIFLYTDILTYKGERWDEDGRKVAITAMLVKPKDQPYWGGIYVSPPRYEVWPVGGWPMWPEQLGKPLGMRKWEGNTVTRQFEKGFVSVMVGEKPEFIVQIRY
jgi:hypothetical protein